MKKNACFIIAEAGVNHNGDIKLAKKLIDIAKSSGADAVKFQSFKAHKLVTKNAQKARYQLQTTAAQESQFEMLKKLELSAEDHKVLFDYCRQKKITFLSTPFDEESADFLDKLGVTVFKIPSGEVTNDVLLSHVAAKKKPIILSTGMSTLKEVKHAVSVLREAGNKKITLLHCVTEYPAPFSEVNLRAMETMRKTFKVPVGFSDHTQGIAVAVAAAALGASVIEKHFTLDRKMSGPDHKASLEPNELAEMITMIRVGEESLGDGRKVPAPSERKNIVIARKSLVAARDILKGQRISRADIDIKRPGSGIAPQDLRKVVGRISRTDIAEDELLAWSHLK